MTESEIIENLAKTRGTILCLGLNDIPPLSLLGISGTQTNWTNVIIIPTLKQIFAQELKCFIKGLEWRVINYCTKLPINSLFIVTSIPKIVKEVQYESGQDKIEFYLDSLCDEFNLQAICLIDSFPFHTKEGLQIIDSISKYCEPKNLSFKVGLLYGINKYGSTDISTEDEAVNQEKKFLREEKNIQCFGIDKGVNEKNVLSFFIQNSASFKNAVELFKKDCTTTIDNLELTVDVLYSLLLIPLNSSLVEYISLIKSKLKDLELLYPVQKYFNDSFFIEYQNSIASKFNSRRDSTNNEISQWCVKTLSCAIEQWIKSSKITLNYI